MTTADGETGTGAALLPEEMAGVPVGLAVDPVGADPHPPARIATAATAAMRQLLPRIAHPPRILRALDGPFMEVLTRGAGAVTAPVGAARCARRPLTRGTG